MRFILYTLIALALTFSSVQGKKKESGSSSSKASNVDTKKLEGTWKITYYYNKTSSMEVIRKCEKQENLEWTIKGSSWNVNYENDKPSEELVFKSNGRWTVKQINSGSDSDYVKIEVMENNIDRIEPCFAIQRQGKTLIGNLNFLNSRECPTKFIPTVEFCRNDTVFFMGECQDGKCMSEDDDSTNSTSNSTSESASSAGATQPQTYLLYLVIAAAAFWFN